MSEDLPPITLPAEYVGPAWKNAIMASSDDRSRTSLYRTVYIEWFARGLRFVSTDGYVLVASWADRDRDPITNLAPARELAPIGSVVALAADNLMPDFLKHRAAEVKAWQREKFDGLDPDPIDVTFSIGTIDEPNTGQQRLDIGDQRALIVSADNERIALPLLDGAEFPGWRTILGGYKAKPREKVRAGAALLDRLGQLRTGAWGDVLDLTMATTSARVDAQELVLVTGAGRVPVEGAFVPLREADEQAEDEAA